MTTDSRRKRLPIFFLLWIVLIFATSSTVIRPREFFDLVEIFTGADQKAMQRFALFWGLAWFTFVKGWHITEFVILTMLTTGAVKWWCGRLTSRSVIAAMLFCLVFAVSDEWHQSFVKDRIGSIQDVLLDSLGILLAGSIMLLRLERNREDANSEVG